MKSEKVRASLLFAFSLLLFTSAANAAVELPEGYRRVEWIESTKGGGQFINTKFNPTWDTRIVADFDSMTPSQDWGVFFGVTERDSSKDGVLLRYFGNSNDLNGWFCNEKHDEARIANLAGKRLAAELQKNGMTLNGQTATITMTGTPYGGPIYLFCGNNGGTPWRHQEMRLYSFKIFEGETPVRDFVPCIELATVAAGLYDVVEGKFYPNAGWGEFRPDETMPEGYRRVEYIESTKGGNQYIDTEYTANANTRVELDAYIPPKAEQSDAACVLFGSRTVGDWAAKAFSVQLFGVDFIRFAYNGKFVDSPTGKSFGERMTITCDMNQLEWTGSQPGSTPVTVSPLARSKSTLYIFGDNTVAQDDEKCNGPFNPSVMKLYSFKIFEGKALKHNFVPCVETASGNAGLYDVVGRKFHLNKGGDRFRCPGCSDFIGITQANFGNFRTLRKGNTYRFVEDVDFAAAAGASAMTVEGGARVEVVVPKDVTVKLSGGAANGWIGAGAGIEVPQNATLVVRGAGDLFAVGGAAANGANGGQGASGYVSSVRPQVESASGGVGGFGGGGGGAGIGGRGGNGGGGGAGGAKVYDSFKNCLKPGNSGANGGPGTNGADCGTIEIRETVTVFARGGAAGANGAGGKGVDWAPLQHGWWTRAAYGGGGGGGGGGGSWGADIGGGGGGGGAGGGGGGSGLSYFHYNKSAIAAMKNGKGAEGGKADNGSTGGKGEDRCHKMVEYNGSKAETETKDDGNGRGGSGGMGGAAGAKGAGGTLTVEPTASCTSEGRYDIWKISDTERIRWDNGKLFRIKDGQPTELAYETVNASMSKLDGGKWYVVKDVVNHNGSIDVGEGEAANLVLLDRASLTANCGTPNRAGIMVLGGRALNVFSVSSGALTAIGGMCGAGIGGGERGAGGTVTINGGTVTATAGDAAAGIGGGRYGVGGTVTINGGTVTARGGAAAAGIGGGQECSGGTVTINGGTVTAHGGGKKSNIHGTGGAGIGGGWRGSGGMVTINGGRVTATGGWEGAGIGGSYIGGGGTVTINGGVVTAHGGDDGAGIGGGYGAGGTVTIRAGTVTATGGRCAAGIGGGYDGNGGTVTIDGGNVTAQGGWNAAGIGGGRVMRKGSRGNGGTVTINGGTVTARGDGDGAGIGGGGLDYRSYGGGGGRLTINGGTVTAFGYGDDGTPFGAGKGGYPRGSLTLGPRIVKIDNNHYREGNVLFYQPSYMRLVSAANEKGLLRTDMRNGFVSVLAEPKSTVTLTFGLAEQGYRWVGSNVITVKLSDEWVELPPEALPQVKDAVLSLTVPDDRFLVSATAENRSPVKVTTKDGITYVSTFPNAGRVTLAFAPKDVGWRCANEAVITVKPIDENATFPAGDIPKTVEDLIADPVEYLGPDGGTATAAGVRRINQAAPQQNVLSSGWYMAADKMSVSTLNVTGTVNLILADGATLTVNGGVRVEPGNTLNIFCQCEKTGKLFANGDQHCAGIGGGNGASGGTVTVNGGEVSARGGNEGAGIGGGDRGASGTVTINGGRITAIGSAGGRGIGCGGYGGGGGGVSINGGTVEADGWRGLGRAATIDGGSVKTKTSESPPKNAARDFVYCVTVKCTGLEGLVSLEGLEDYGTNDVYAINGRVYLWLPNGEHFFAISDGETTYRYFAAVGGRGFTVEPLTSGFTVNGTDILKGPGEGWEYDGEVLLLKDDMTYVLSGVATNDLAQVKVAESGATVVLSNAVVFTEGRLALNLVQNATLRMAGGTSFLAATNESAAVSVAAGAALTVGLASGANEVESMICVFSSGNAKAIGGTGPVAVNGGTLAVWADSQAVETPGMFTNGTDEVLMTGETFDTLKYARACDDKPCVFVAPGVTVTVKSDIPHVTGFTISNAVMVIEGVSVEGGTAYRVLPGDDVFVGYTLEEGYASKSANPLVYTAVDSNIIVDAESIPTVPNIPYRAWNEETRRMEDCVCANYTVVTADTALFESNRWYVVTSDVSRGKITVNGLAHLILCDGATLTANGGKWEPGVEVRGVNSLHIYGQSGGLGAIVANGGYGGSGIGGGDGGGAAGTVTIDGGNVTAQGGWNGAGIGGGNQDAGGTVTINGGKITAIGCYGGRGIGCGGYGGGGGIVSINGGTVDADGWNGKGLGGSVTIDGGSVKTKACESQPTNGADEPVYRVTAKIPSIAMATEDKPLVLGGLGEYGTNDVYAVKNDKDEGCVYLYLPSGTYRFSLSDGATTYRYYVEVKGIPITVEPLPVGFLVNGVDVGSQPGTGWTYEGSVLSLNSAQTYVLSGVATNNEVQVKVTPAGATVVLSNAVVFTSGSPALDVAQNASLKMAGGTSYLAATNESAAVSVAAGTALTVGLASGADGAESMIGVFNYGEESAIVGPGSVNVGSGTFFVWSDWQAVGAPGDFTCGAGEVLMTGETPETLRYVMACDDGPCVLVTPGATVTVKDIPHVTGFTVSNAVQEIEGVPVTDGTEYRVLPGDDVFVGYTVEEGYVSKSANPLVYTAVESNITVTAEAIRIVPTVPYRAWNAEKGQMEDCVCTNYTVVTAEMTAFESNQWYVVVNDVARGAITVGDSAHLILCDDVTLTANALTGGSLAIYGQAENGGALVVSGTVGTALTVVGGNVKAGSVATRAKNAMGEDVYCVTCEGIGDQGLGIRVIGLDGYGIEKARLIDGKGYLWLPNGTHYFTLSVTLSDGKTTCYCYCAEVNGADITVKPAPLPEPVTPGEPSGPYTTAEEATNVADRAVLVPTEKVAEALETDEAIMTYCNLFGFAVTGGGEAWFVNAALYPEAWTNVVESAQAATRQIDVAGIAALATDGKKDVSVTNCVPGFYYTLYGAQGLTAPRLAAPSGCFAGGYLPETGTAYGPKLSGVSGEVTFPEVVKPSDAAGFFSIGASEVPGDTP